MKKKETYVVIANPIFYEKHKNIVYLFYMVLQEKLNFNSILWH